MVGDFNYRSYVQQQLPEDEWIRINSLGLNLDGKTIAEIFPDFVNYERRARSEIPFLLEHVAGLENSKILDTSLGTGATSIGLKLAGIDEVVSNDLDQDAVSKAVEEAKRIGRLHGRSINLDVRHRDWRELASNFENEFDAVICTGNSLTYLFRREDQFQALANFHAVLKHGGLLVVDERNYAEHFLEGNGANYRFTGKVVYCGKDKVDAHPIYVSDKVVVMEYHHREKRLTAHLVMHPFKKGEVAGLMREAGFADIKTFGDYKESFNPEEPEFIAYVGRKSNR